MNDRQKNTAFLKRLMLYEDSDNSRQLEERIRNEEKAERLVLWALARVVFLTVLSPAGVYYSMFLLPDFLQHQSEFILRFFLALSFASFISMATFVGLWVHCRKVLNGHYNQCRDMVGAAFERSLKQVSTIPFPRRVQPVGEDARQNQTIDSEGNPTTQWQRAI